MIALMLLAETASAFSGSQLVEKCDASFAGNPNKQDNSRVLEIALDSGSCAGFIGGVVHGVNLVGSMLQKQGATNKNFICLPKGLHATNLVKITLMHYKQNPQDADLPAQLGVFNAFVKKYPCGDPASK
jgi:hypothetical protein